MDCPCSFFVAHNMNRVDKIEGMNVVDLAFVIGWSVTKQLSCNRVWLKTKGVCSDKSKTNENAKMLVNPATECFCLFAPCHC